MAQFACPIWFFHITVISSDCVWLHHSFGQCPRGVPPFEMWPQAEANCCSAFPRAVLSSPWALLGALVAADLPRRAVWSGWVSSEGHSPPPSCRWCSCSQGHFRSSFSLQTCSLSRQPLEFLWKTSASHSPCKEQRQPERSLTLHTAEADSAEATAEFWSCTSIASRNNSVSPSATSAFSVFLL